MDKKLNKIELSDLKKELALFVDQTLAKSTKRPPSETAEALLSWSRAQEFYDEMIKEIPNLKNKNLLEIGCGYSLFLAICRKNGIKAVGIEPASQEFYQHTLNISREILKRAGVNQNIIKKGIGEKIPYPKNTFDAVVSLYTLEHVQNVKKVLKESVRVLKPGGFMYMVVPNYGSFWEGHYGIVWIPYLPKSLAKIYVRFFGKKPDALDDYQLINQFSLEKTLKNLPVEIESWGNSQFSKQVLDLKLSGGTLGSAKKIIQILKNIELLKIAVFLANLLKAQTPIILVARKN